MCQSQQDYPFKAFITILILGIFFLLGGLFFLYRSLSIISTSATAVGEVFGSSIYPTSTKWVHDSLEKNGLTDDLPCHYKSEIEGFFSSYDTNLGLCFQKLVFRTNNNELIEEWTGEETHVSERRPVQVYYNPNHPREFVIRRFKYLWLMPTYFLSIALLLLICSIVTAIRVPGIIRFLLALKSIVGNLISFRR